MSKLKANTLVLRFRTTSAFKNKVEKLSKKHNLNLSETMRKGIQVLEDQGEK